MKYGLNDPALAGYMDRYITDYDEDDDYDCEESEFGSLDDSFNEEHEE